MSSLNRDRTRKYYRQRSGLSEARLGTGESYGRDDWDKALEHYFRPSLAPGTPPSSEPKIDSSFLLDVEQERTDQDSLVPIEEARRDHLLGSDCSPDLPGDLPSEFSGVHLGDHRIYLGITPNPRKNEYTYHRATKEGVKAWVRDELGISLGPQEAKAVGRMWLSQDDREDLVSELALKLLEARQQSEKVAFLNRVAENRRKNFVRDLASERYFEEATLPSRLEGVANGIGTVTVIPSEGN